jgi:hypothetical protein
MRYLKMFGLVAIATVAFSSVAGAGTASATTLTVGGVAKNSSVEYSASLASGTSTVVKDSAGTTTNTCTSSTFKGKTEGTFTGEAVGGNISSFTFGNCTHKMTILRFGKLIFRWLFGGAALTITDFEWKTVSTAFGVEATCKFGTGTEVGTLTGVSSGNATIDVNAKVNCGILGTASWTGTYTVTSPSGLSATS